MALKALLLKKQIDNKRKALNGLLETRKAHEEREAELTRAIEEVETEEQRADVESLVNEFDRDINLIKAEAKAQDMFMQKQAEIKRLPYRSRARER